MSNYFSDLDREDEQCRRGSIVYGLPFAVALSLLAINFSAQSLTPRLEAESASQMAMQVTR